MPAAMDYTTFCFYCSSPSSPCPFCGLVGVCGASHMVIHRPYQECLPFLVEERDHLGNVIVAARDIKPFEPVIVDRPAVIAPFDDSQLCLECSKQISVWYVCSQCNLPLCGASCEAGPHHQPECLILRKLNPKISVDPTDTTHPIYSAVGPLRMLHLRENNKEVWEQVDRLMDHVKERRKDKIKWEFVMENVVRFLIDKCCVKETEETIERMVGIPRTNSVNWEGNDENRVGHALCPIFSILNHSCVNNTKYVQMDTGDIFVRATVLIKKGEEVTTQYRSPNDGNLVRRLDFPVNWCFNCCCRRCSDSTELGTMASALLCGHCGQNQLVSQDSLDMAADWRCGGCGKAVDVEIVLAAVEEVDKDFRSLSYTDDPPVWEDFLTRSSKLVHENHYIRMKAKRILIQLYGSREGYRLEQLPRNLLDRKIDLCNNYIEIFSVLEPGYRQWKGRVLEELSGPFLMTIKTDSDSGSISHTEFLLKYKKLMNMMKEAAKCRQFDPPKKDGDHHIGNFYKAFTLQISG